MKATKFLLSITLLVALCGCNTGTSAEQNTQSDDSEVAEQHFMPEQVNVSTENNAYLSIGNDELQTIKSDADFIGGNPSDPKDIWEKASYVGLVTIKSIDGGDNLNYQTNDYTYPYTYGTMHIEKVYKGTWEAGQQVGYIRMGGIITWQKYYDSLYEAQKEKINSQSNGQHPAYVSCSFNDDISIEVGKTYLVYANSSDVMEEINGLKVFTIFGWQGGLREVDTINLQGTTPEGNGLKVMNNYTGSWDNIEDAIPSD